MRLWNVEFLILTEMLETIFKIKSRNTNFYTNISQNDNSPTVSGIL
jgi:hypothetical protein